MSLLTPNGFDSVLWERQTTVRVYYFGPIHKTGIKSKCLKTTNRYSFWLKTFFASKNKIDFQWHNL